MEKSLDYRVMQDFLCMLVHDNLLITQKIKKIHA